MDSEGKMSGKRKEKACAVAYDRRITHERVILDQAGFDT